MASVALSPQDQDQIIARISSGEFTSLIADELGIPKPTLRGRLLSHPGYADAIKNQAESLVERATAEMMDKGLAADNAVIARARARVDTAHKWAAARDPATWGQRVTADVNASLVVHVVRVAAPELDRSRVIEQENNTVVFVPPQQIENKPK